MTYDVVPDPFSPRLGVYSEQDGRLHFVAALHQQADGSWTTGPLTISLTI